MRVHVKVLQQALLFETDIFKQMSFQKFTDSIEFNGQTFAQSGQSLRECDFKNRSAQNEELNVKN